MDSQPDHLCGIIGKNPSKMPLFLLHFCVCNTTPLPKAKQGRTRCISVCRLQPIIVESQKHGGTMLSAWLSGSYSVVVSIWLRIICTGNEWCHPQWTGLPASVNDPDTLWKTCPQAYLMGMLPHSEHLESLGGRVKVTELTRQYLRNNAWGWLLTSTVMLTNTHGCLYTCTYMNIHIHMQMVGENK